MRLVLKREISAEVARMIAPVMVDVYHLRSPTTVSVTLVLKEMEESVQVCIFVFFLISPYPRICSSNLYFYLAEKVDRFLST